MWKQPVADGGATVGAESEPERANALAGVDKRELGSFGALPPCRSAFDDVARGDTAVVEPTTDLRIVDRCLYGRDVRRPEWMQRDNGIRKRRIGRAQLHRAGSYVLTFTCDQRRRDDYAGSGRSSGHVPVDAHTDVLLGLAVRRERSVAALFDQERTCPNACAIPESLPRPSGDRHGAQTSQAADPRRAAKGGGRPARRRARPAASQTAAPADEQRRRPAGGRRRGAARPARPGPPNPNTN